MRKFYTTLFLALVYTMATFAQGLPITKSNSLDLGARMMSAKKEIVGNNIIAMNGKYSVKGAAKAPVMRADEQLITPPESAEIETDWTLTGSYIYNGDPYANTNDISVAFYDDDIVFIKGMSLLCPDGWIVGQTFEVEGETYAYFPNGQYVGDYYGDSIFVCGTSDGKELDDIYFQYDAESKKFELYNLYIENTSTTEFSYYFYSNDIVICKDFSAPENVNVQPSSTTADVSWTQGGDIAKWNLRYRKYIDLGESDNIFYDFEDESQFNEFTVIDSDGDGNNWYYANSSGIIGNGGSTGVATSASYAGGVLTPDNWLITPKVPLGGSVSFYACGQDPSYAAEVFAVYVCNGEYRSVKDFVKVTDDFTATGTMTKYSVDLSTYEGDGYIAIRHYNVTDMFRLNIDDVCIVPPGGTGEEEWIVIEDVVDNPYTIEGLDPETDYEVQVQAVQGTLKSSWTKSTIFTTLAETEIIVTVSEAATDGEYNYATMFYGDKNLSVPEGIKAYTATVANGEITLHEISGAIPAGTAVVLRTDSKLRETTDFEFSIVDEAEDIEADNMLKGSDEATTVSGNGFKYYMLSLNGDSEPGSIGFYFDKESNGGIQLKNGAHKAYLAVPEDAADAKGYPFGGDATGIEGLNVNDNDNVNEVYDLQGRRVVRPAKGIYIVNGKKIVVK